MTAKETLKNNWALVVLIVIGAILRLYQLGWQCMGYDETFTLDMIRQPAVTIFWSSLISDCNPPTWYLAAHFSYLLSGGIAWAIRFPFVVCGIVLIPVMFQLGKEYRNRTVGLYVAGITATMYPLVYYSQYARAYSPSVLCFALLLILFFRIKNGDAHLETYGWFGAAIALNFWIHYFSFLPISLLVLDLFLTRSKKGVILSCIIGGMLSSPLAISFADLKSRMGETFGFSIRQLIIAAPWELFSILCPVYLLVCILELRHGYLPYSRELILICIADFILGLILAPLAPFSPHYWLTISLIPILILAGTTDRLIPYKDELLIIGFSLLLLAFQMGPFIGHYTIQQYPCTGVLAACSPKNFVFCG